MKTTILVLGGLGLVLGASLLAQPSVPSAVGDSLFPPDLLKTHHQVLNLTEEQKAWLIEEVAKVEGQVAEMQRQSQKEQDALAAVLKKARVDEAAALAQADKALDLEREIKRAQFLLLVRIKNKLTPEQQATLTEIKARGAVLQEKLRKAQEIAKRWQAEGKDFSQVQQLKDEFETQARAGKVKEAEATLDKALKILEGK